jgi:hypothetical protein
MVAKASGIDTVFVRVINAAASPSDRYAQSSATSSGDDPRRLTPYLALIYSQLPLQVTPVIDPPGGQPTEWSGEPLVGVETFVVHWGPYSEYMDAYLDGEKGAWMMKDRLFEALPPNLSAILSGEFGGSRPSRTWFHSEALEVSQLPWELLAFANGHRAQIGGSFVRGVPPESATPLIPVVGQLRLGVVDPQGRMSGALGQALDNAAQHLTVTPLSGGLRAALRQAVDQGIELVHVVADASITSAYDGVLEVHGTDDPPIASSEIASLLRGSRVRLMGLTPPTEDPAQRSRGYSVVPVAYRAFTYFATSPYPVPTIVAPMGPMDDSQVVEFWTTFYSTLGESLEIEAAMAEAQRRRMVPVALFLRQLQPGTFRRVSEAEQPETDPSVIGAELASSRELIQQFETLKSNLGLKTASVDKLVKKELNRQSKLESDVSPWIEGVYDE